MPSSSQYHDRWNLDLHNNIDIIFVYHPGLFASRLHLIKWSITAAETVRQRFVWPAQQQYSCLERDLCFPQWLISVTCCFLNDNHGHRDADSFCCPAWTLVPHRTLLYDLALHRTTGIFVPSTVMVLWLWPLNSMQLVTSNAGDLRTWAFAVVGDIFA